MPIFEQTQFIYGSPKELAAKSWTWLNRERRAGLTTWPSLPSTNSWPFLELRKRMRFAFQG